MSRPGGPGTRALAAWAGAAAVVSLPAACTERPLTGVDPDDAPGPRLETVEVTLPAEALPSWRDTAVSGFALPGEGGFVLVATRTDLRARALLRYANLPDSVRIGGDTVPAEPIDSFTNVTLAVTVDTAGSEFPPFPFTIEARSLERSFDGDEVDWTRAREGEPWATPGGDLGTLLGFARVDSLIATATMDLLVSGDSLLRAWRASEGRPGVAILLREPGGRLRATSTVLGFDIFAGGEPDTLASTRVPTEQAFIYDPPQPGGGIALRLGGLPSWRGYLAFELPAEVQGIPLADATINHAALVLHPLAAPDAPFALGGAIAVRSVRLLGDPFVLGPKTPIGSVGALLGVSADSLTLGLPVRLDITSQVVDRLEAEDVSEPFRLGVRPTPDGQALGFWEFGSVEHPNPALRPELLLIVTSPATFGVP